MLNLVMRCHPEDKFEYFQRRPCKVLRIKENHYVVGLVQHFYTVDNDVYIINTAGYKRC